MTAAHVTPRSSMAVRSSGWWGLAFVVLLLVSAGMATTPGRGTPEPLARAFYVEHVGVVALAQVVGLLAAAAFLPLAVGLQRQSPGRRGVAAAGFSVAGAAVLTALPVLTLLAVAPTAQEGLLRALLVACDLADVVLFAAIAGFAVTVALAAPARWVKAVGLLVAAISVARAILLVAGSSLLELTAPLAFLVLVSLLSIAAARGRALLGGARAG
jgi:hypothetical protein